MNDVAISVRPGTKSGHFVRSSPGSWYRVWVTFGIVCLLAEAITLGRWLTSPLFHPAPVGIDLIPAAMLVTVRIMECLGLVGFMVASWLFLIRPLRHRQALDANSRIFLAMSSTYWLDPLYNYTNVVWYYNAHAFNMGSWASLIPGWLSPGMETFPEPLLGAGCLWFVAFGAIAKLGSWFYGLCRQWFGSNAQVRPVGLLFVSATLLNFAYENLYIRMGVFGFQGAWRPLTLWAGTRFQFPLYESPMNALLITSIVLLAYYRDDQGLMVCERGVHRLQVSARAKTCLSVIATCGFGHFIVLFVWMCPYQWFATHVTVTAELPSYFRAGVCGEGTPRACPDGRFGVPTTYMQRDFTVAPTDPRLRGPGVQSH